MFKIPRVYKFTNLLNSKGNKFYWTPSNPEEFNKLYFIKQNYDIPEDIKQILEEQEKIIKNLNKQLTILQTNHQKVIKKIYNKLCDINTKQNIK